MTAKITHSLSELVGEAAKVAWQIQDIMNDEEITPEERDSELQRLIEEHSDTQESIDEKVEQCFQYRAHLAGIEATLVEESRRLAAKAKTISNSRDWFERYVVNCIKGNKRTKAGTPIGSVVLSIRKNSKLVVANEDAIPKVDEYWKQPPPVLNKIALKKAIADGQQIEGAFLQDTEVVMWK